VRVLEVWRNPVNPPTSSKLQAGELKQVEQEAV
jgi:hypothetical protein